MMQTREEYILKQARELQRIAKKRLKLLNRSNEGYQNFTPKAWSKLTAEMSWEAMHYEKTRERLGYALGFLNKEDLRGTYEPSGWHTYEGIKKEVENLKFSEQ